MKNANVQAWLVAAIGTGGYIHHDGWPEVRRYRSNRETARYYTLDHEEHTPKPEVMFKELIRTGRARIVRRRFKPPLLVFIKRRRR